MKQCIRSRLVAKMLYSIRCSSSSQSVVVQNLPLKSLFMFDKRNSVAECFVLSVKEEGTTAVKLKSAFFVKKLLVVSEHSRAADVYMHICFMPKNHYFICGLLFLASFFRGEGAVVLVGQWPGEVGGGGSCPDTRSIG